jgi:hypothetical protein
VDGHRPDALDGQAIVRTKLQAARPPHGVVPKFVGCVRPNKTDYMYLGAGK